MRFGQTVVVFLELTEIKTGSSTKEFFVSFYPID